MMGGKEDPCTNIPVWQQTYPTVCPRVELLPENDGGIAELALLGARAGVDHPLWGTLLALHAQDLGLTAGETRDVLWRVVTALSDKSISGRIKAARDRAVKESSRG